ncbi:MAG TPA: Coenzyme F420 hydrogenase/dehydrogenase, beta subunit C-terminal domain [Methanospirillum sp.]|uniref:Coenzyme F420 hydrogenase/dehydrogenase, beta subunit C-terminal domain n=1 Tax=Methanospirillum sp. TaxID=45200 RepID=UPI002C088918|nr:Coenzyme F420 hydrogenase/dehydrogenase, beta subunit C-terminal domain [Methanospirillum sp.]HWQ64495.1 Coenzyme F420 hydrogenase/dehydrogenase, beta subunit C-terminal domain [Methanospirillum sp.]
MIRKGEIFYAWSTDSELRDKGSSGGFVSGLLTHLLSTGIVDAVSVTKKGADIYDASMVILTDPTEIAQCSGSLYCGTLSSAKYLYRYTQSNPGQRIAAVVKGCEAKAIIELAKRNRVNLNDILLIGLTCSGTINPITARKMIVDRYEIDPDTVENIYFSQGKCQVETSDTIFSLPIEDLEQDGYGRRLCCQRCQTRIPRQCDLVCGDWGVIGEYSGNTTCIEVCSKKGAITLESAINDHAIVVEAADPQGVEMRSRVEEAMQMLSLENGKEQFSKIPPGDQLLKSMMLDMSRCIKCYQCTEACPLCVCEDCRTKKPWLVKPGQVPPPFMFHLIRASHIADSCINCGQCEERCPMEIPNSLYMHALQSELEQMFGYKAGELPGTPVVAKVNEWEEWEHNYGNTFEKVIEVFRDQGEY